jgi:methyltransferase (TIGR00027 family)
MKAVSKTAYYCCGLRMEDAKRPAPVCGDTYAEVFMDAAGREFFERFREETRPNSGNLVRHRLIDDILRAELVEDPQRRVFTIGAGFDTRPYRLDGGRWTEVDARELIAYKNERLPVASARNELVRIPIDFDSQELGDVLAPFATGEPVVVVIEGVLIYLDVRTISDMLGTLRRLFPDHRVVCDLMTRAMYEKYAVTMQQKLAGADAPLEVTEADPAGLFTRAGYSHRTRISIPESMNRFRMAGRVPNILLKTFLRTLYRGYTVNVFTTGAG